METTTNPEAKMNFADMYQVSWEHEYFTDDDAAAFETKDAALAAARKLAEAGKRRIRISGPEGEVDLRGNIIAEDDE